MGSEFSTTRARDEETRRVLTERMDAKVQVLSERMVSLFDKKDRLMRLLHEDLVHRIATLREDRP